jgi:exonuclease V gamma subunit
LQNWPKVEVLFSKNLNTDPLVLDQLDFYRVENILTAYEEIVDEENKAQEEQQKKYEKELPQPEYGGFKVPKMDIPKINMPNMPKF